MLWNAQCLNKGSSSPPELCNHTGCTEDFQSFRCPSLVATSSSMENFEKPHIASFLCHSIPRPAVHFHGQNLCSPRPFSTNLCVPTCQDPTMKINQLEAISSCDSEAASSTLTVAAQLPVCFMQWAASSTGSLMQLRWCRNPGAGELGGPIAGDALVPASATSVSAAQRQTTVAATATRNCATGIEVVEECCIGFALL